MKAKLQALWAFVQPYLSKAYMACPLAVGIAVGYLGHPIIKVSISIVMNVLKSLLSWI